jgi:flagellar basal-body rod protein FlgF
MWTAVSGANARSQQVDTIANNLANADTLAYKKDTVTFKEYLADLENAPEAKAIKPGPTKDSEFYPLDGKDRALVAVDGTHAQFQQGHLRITQRSLDVALDGNGFLEVSTPQGIRYTRAGSLRINGDGKLVTTQGFPVLSAQAGGLTPETLANPLSPELQKAAIEARTISLSDRTAPISISQSGEIFIGDQAATKLSVVEFKNRGGLFKVGTQLFENRDPGNIAASDPARSPTLVRQGALETSNVNPAEEMTRLIQAHRMFEQDMKSLKTFSDLMGREVNDVGRL